MRPRPLQLCMLSLFADRIRGLHPKTNGSRVALYSAINQYKSNETSFTFSERIGDFPVREL